MNTTMNMPMGSNYVMGGKPRKLSEYNKFVKTEFKKAKAENPSKKAPEILKIVAKKWRESGKGAKKPTKATKKTTRKTTKK